MVHLTLFFNQIRFAGQQRLIHSEIAVPNQNAVGWKQVTVLNPANIPHHDITYWYTTVLIKNGGCNHQEDQRHILNRLPDEWQKRFRRLRRDLVELSV